MTDAPERIWVLPPAVSIGVPDWTDCLHVEASASPFLDEHDVEYIRADIVADMAKAVAARDAEIARLRAAIVGDEAAKKPTKVEGCTVDGHAIQIGESREPKGSRNPWSNT